MSDAGAICRQCRHLFVVNKGDSWWRWLCMKAPMPARWNPVLGETIADPPYALCRYTNSGDCEHFEAGFNQLNPKVTDGNAQA